VMFEDPRGGRCPDMFGSPVWLCVQDESRPRPRLVLDFDSTLTEEDTTALIAEVGGGLMGATASSLICKGFGRGGGTLGGWLSPSPLPPPAPGGTLGVHYDSRCPDLASPPLTRAVPLAPRRPVCIAPPRRWGRSRRHGGTWRTVTSRTTHPCWGGSSPPCPPTRRVSSEPCEHVAM
jgi:hypothetical protein